MSKSMPFFVALVSVFCFVHAKAEVTNETVRRFMSSSFFTTVFYSDTMKANGMGSSIYELKYKDGKVSLGTSGNGLKNTLSNTDYGQKAVLQIDVNNKAAITLSQCASSKDRTCITTVDTKRRIFTMTQFSPKNDSNIPVVTECSLPSSGPVELNNCLSFSQDSCGEWTKYAKTSKEYNNLKIKYQEIRQCISLMEDMRKVDAKIIGIFRPNDVVARDAQESFQLARMDSKSFSITSPISSVGSPDKVNVKAFAGSDLNFLEQTAALEAVERKCGFSGLGYDNSIQSESAYKDILADIEKREAIARAQNLKETSAAAASATSGSGRGGTSGASGGQQGSDGRR